MEKATKSDILLETGTNELEIVVFRVANEYYGINVAKVREIIRTDIAIVPLPDGNPSILGVVNLRGKIIPVVDLAKHLNITTEFDKKSRIIITRADFQIRPDIDRPFAHAEGRFAFQAVRRRPANATSDSPPRQFGSATSQSTTACDNAMRLSAKPWSLLISIALTRAPGWLETAFASTRLSAATPSVA